MDDSAQPKPEPPTLAQRIAGAKFDLTCPHCAMDPVTLNARDVSFGNMIVLVISCVGCRNVLSASFHGQMDPRLVGRGLPPGLLS